MIDKVEILLANLDLEECFEVLDITPYEVIELLLGLGLVSLPPFLEDYDEPDIEETDE